MEKITELDTCTYILILQGSPHPPLQSKSSRDSCFRFKPRPGINGVVAIMIQDITFVFIKLRDRGIVPRAQLIMSKSCKSYSRYVSMRSSPSALSSTLDCKLIGEPSSLSSGRGEEFTGVHKIGAPQAEGYCDSTQRVFCIVRLSLAGQERGNN